jgi:hypothetical protein
MGQLRQWTDISEIFRASQAFRCSSKNFKPHRQLIDIGRFMESLIKYLLLNETAVDAHPHATEPAVDLNEKITYNGATQAPKG